MSPDLLDEIEAAVFVARHDTDCGLVIEAANASFRAAAGLRGPPEGLASEPVLPAAWATAAAAATVSGSADLPPARLAGAPGLVAGVVRRLAGEPPRLVGTVAPLPADADGEAADILDLLSEMVCRWRPDGTVYYCNAAYARVCGLEKAAVVGANLADFTPAMELSQILVNVRRLGPDCPVAAYDHRVPQPDGSERWQEWIDRALFGPDGRTVVAYQSTGRDITHRKRAEEALRRSQQRLQLALVAGNQGAWDFDVERSALSYDPVLDQRLGQRLGLDTGRSAGRGNLPDWDARLHPDDRARVLAAFDRLVDGVTDRFVEEYRLRREDGGYTWVFDNAVAVDRDENRRARRIVGTSADNDARHRADERLKESEQRLRLALEAAELAIWEVDLQAGGGWLRIDGIGAERFGRGRASLQMPLAGLRWLLGRRDDLRRLHRRYRAHVEGKAERILAEVQARRADGTVHWVEVYGIITERDADGRPLRLVGVTANVTRRKEAELRLADLALQDHLTGLPNRRALDESLAQAVARARREGEPLALMLLDLDGFKRVNDTLGHLAGDKVLAEAARRLRTCVRRSDALARFGGDEFAVVAAGFGERRRLERLAVRIAALLGRPVGVDGAVAVIGVSIGVATFPEDGATPVELLGRADAALYAAKRARSGFRFAADLDGSDEAAPADGSAPPG